jgi:hypothetical protein
VVVDLDNTLCKLEVDWGAVKERLERLASEAGTDVEDDGIWPLMEAARQPGSEPLLEEMERLVTRPSWRARAARAIRRWSTGWTPTPRARRCRCCR